MRHARFLTVYHGSNSGHCTKGGSAEGLWSCIPAVLVTQIPKKCVMPKLWLVGDDLKCGVVWCCGVVSDTRCCKTGNDEALSWRRYCACS